MVKGTPKRVLFLIKEAVARVLPPFKIMFELNVQIYYTDTVLLFTITKEQSGDYDTFK